MCPKNDKELTVNITQNRNIEDFAEGLSCIYKKMAKALKPNSPLVFTYHHNNFDAYIPIAMAILDSGLLCTKTLACPTEMSASIHINGTTSSVVDSIFVCRKTNKEPLLENIQFEKELLQDASSIKKAGIRISRGDIKCMAYGLIIGEVIKNLKTNWNDKKPFSVKRKIIKDEMNIISDKYTLNKSIQSCWENISKR